MDCLVSVNFEADELVLACEGSIIFPQHCGLPMRTALRPFCNSRKPQSEVKEAELARLLMEIPGVESFTVPGDHELRIRKQPAYDWSDLSDAVTAAVCQVYHLPPNAVSLLPQPV